MDRSRITILFLFLSCTLFGCERCTGATVAELLEGEGSIERNEVSTDAWASAPIGQRFRLGDAVRTGDAATATLRVGAAGGVKMLPRTVLRFLSERPGAVRLEAGEVELESNEGVDFETELGALRLERGSRVLVRDLGDDGVRVEVIAGRVIFEDDGEERQAEAGRVFVLAVGSVVFEDEEPTVALAPTEPPHPEDEETDTAGENDEADEANSEVVAVAATEVTIETSPGRAHLEIPVGESPTIHDPHSSPIAVRLNFGPECAGRGLVVLRSGRRTTRWAGEGSTIVVLSPGRHVYALECAGTATRRGSITIRRDDGSTRLQSVAPRNVVDSDGRTYDVLYQNALPIITVRWRGESGAATLRMASGERERSFPAPGARVELRSGEVGEGTHRLWFMIGTRRSPETTLRIRFDNAAATAMIRAPSTGTSLAPGSTVHVSGAVLPDTDVRAGGSVLPVDPQLRFEGDVTVPVQTDALVIRFSHPRRGVHYYLRRVAGP